MDEQYKINLLLKMYGPPPSDQEVFDLVPAIFEDAMSNYDTGNEFAALTKTKYMTDTMKDQRSVKEVG